MQKRTLSVRDQTTITFEHAGFMIQVPLTRAHFEELTADLLDRTRFTVVNLLQERNLKWDDVTRLLLVGGLTRMPMVQKMLEELSGKKPEQIPFGRRIVRPRRGHLRGTGHGRQDSPKRPEFSVRNVNSHSLGVLGSKKQPACLATA